MGCFTELEVSRLKPVFQGNVPYTLKKGSHALYLQGSVVTGIRWLMVTSLQFASIITLLFFLCLLCRDVSVQSSYKDACNLR